MWVAQAYPFKHPRSLLTSAGLGTMGFGLPAAIGAALVSRDRPVVCFSGDGSIMMNIQELATLAELSLNVTVIVMDNGHLGLVRQQQEFFYGKRYFACKFEKPVDFPNIARGFGIEACHLESAVDPIDQVVHLVHKPGPSLIRIPIDDEQNVLPMVPPGRANHQMILERGIDV